MNTRYMHRLLAGVSISVIALLCQAEPAPGAHSMVNVPAALIAEPLLSPTKSSITLDRGHAAKEAIQASHYAMLQKRLQAMRLTPHVTATPWWNGE